MTELATPATEVEERRPGALALWLLSTSAFFAALAWGLAEGTLFFIVPDVLLTLTALFWFRRSLVHVAAVTVGSLMAGTILYLWAARSPAEAAGLIAQVPFVSDAMFDSVSRDLEAHGAIALLFGPTSGIPYKVYAVSAPEHTSLSSFLLATVPARLERLLISWAMFALPAAALRSRSDNFGRWAVGIWASYWLTVYIYYWSVI